MPRKKNQKPYQIKQPQRKIEAPRPRRSMQNSRLPKWLAEIKIVQKINQMSRRRKIALAIYSGIAVLVLVALLTTMFFAATLGSKERIMNRNKTGVTLLDREGEVFYTFYNAHSNTYVPLSKISKSARQAVISSEDKNFYNHAGFSPRGIANAVWQNIKPGGINSGGSTITQQLVKNALLSEERSYIRKYQELVLSIEIERRYSKDEILEMYLNSVHFGDGTFGIEDAAQHYYAKPAEDLTLAEGSLLAGLLPAPAAYSPISGDAEKAKQRQTYVLRRMHEDKKISKEESTSALSEELHFIGNQDKDIFKAPHFALYVKERLEKQYGTEKIARSGYTVKTTLNPNWQEVAEKAVSRQVGLLASSSVSNGGAVIIDPRTGELSAMVGSADWSNEEFGKYNITTATRQPGSSFKPFVYATGIENKDFTAASILSDRPTDFGGFKPNNNDLRHRGDVTVRRSLANSLNVTAVEALQLAGIEDTIKTARKLGISTIDDKENYGLSLALGTAPAKLTEMVNAYSVFANQGKYNDIAVYTEITDKNNREIFSYKPKNKRAISPQTSYIVSSMLSDNVARSEVFGSSLTLNGGRTAAVKTGTTDSYRDAWAIGYTPSLAAGVWIGNNDNSPMSSIAGASGAAPIWREIMNTILAGSDNEPFPVPDTITIRSICRGSGALSVYDGVGVMAEYFLPGTLPKTRCNETPPVKEEPKPEPKEEEKPIIEKDEDDDDNNSDEEDPDLDDEDDPDTPITIPPTTQP